MRLLDRHIGWHVVAAVMLVLLIVVGLDFVIALVTELGGLSPTYHFSRALHYVLLMTPSRLVEFAPLAALVGCLVGLGTLASQHELTVMRAAGISLLRITWAVLRPVLLFIGLAMLLGEYVAPWTEQLAQNKRAQYRGDTTAKNGLWYRNGDSYILLHTISSDGNVQGISQFSFQHQALTESKYSQVGQFRNNSWYLDASQVTHFTATGPHREQVGKEPWDVAIAPELLSVLNLNPEELSLRDLNSYSHYLDWQQLDARPYRLAFWRKILQPLATLGLVLISISFIFGPLRSVTLGQRVTVGIVVGLIFHYVQDILGPASTVLGLPPMTASLVPMLGSILLGLWLLRRVR